MVVRKGAGAPTHARQWGKSYILGSLPSPPAPTGLPVVGPPTSDSWSRRAVCVCACKVFTAARWETRPRSPCGGWARGGEGWAHLYQLRCPPTPPNFPRRYTRPPHPPSPATQHGTTTCVPSAAPSQPLQQWCVPPPPRPPGTAFPCAPRLHWQTQPRWRAGLATRLPRAEGGAPAARALPRQRSAALYSGAVFTPARAPCRAFCTEAAWAALACACRGAR
jgi:hypothetical protein